MRSRTEKFGKNIIVLTISITELCLLQAIEKRLELEIYGRG